MSFSLQIRNGDLALNGNSFGIVSGSAKLAQDLKCAVLTPYQFYEKYPQYGTALEELIGESDWGYVATQVRAELQRACSDYQNRQIIRNQEDLNRYGRMTIESNEMLLKIANIEMIQVENHLIAKVRIEVGLKNEIEINVPVS